MRILWSVFVEGLRALSANKFRGFLTMLGIVIGVGAIVAVVSIGDSGKRRILDEMEKIAQPTMMWFFPDWVHMQKLQQENKPVKFLEYEELRRVAERTENYGTVTLRISDRTRVHYKDREVRTDVAGVTPDYFRTNGLTLSEGRWMTEDDDKNHRRVSIIGKELAQGLFGDESALGRVIRADKQRYTVVGVLEPKGKSFFSWRSYDNNGYIPIGTMVHRNPDRRRIHWFMGLAHSVDLIPVFRAHVHQAMVEVGTDRDLMMSETFQEETKGFEKVSLALKVLVAGVAGISLFVGGLGIMNIMLVTVKERTREIGLRKAIGASNLSIRLQFFVESILLSSIGGVIGAVSGIGVTYAATHFTAFPTVISIPAVITGVVVSMLTGIVFGIYPAQQASLLDPAEALRYE